MKKKSNNTNFPKKYTWWIIVLIVLLFFSLLSPVIITGTKFLYFFPNNAERIATIISIMNPFIAIAAVIVTYLAFKMQLDANIDMKNNSYRLQLERQFYEMLKIHCDKVEKLHAESIYAPTQKDPPIQKKVEGQDYFRSLLEEFDLIYSEICKLEGLEGAFVKAYRTFFFGIGLTAKGLNKDTAAHFQNFYTLENNKSLFMEKYPKLAPIADSLFMGRMDQLVSYYRHLFLMVKTVAQFNDELFPYEDKRQFLRILRAQLSSAEQVLLYYNWKSGCGEKWEEDSSKPNSNHFFTDFRMIHNIIPKDCWGFSSDEILQSLLEKNPDYRKLNDEDSLFELIDEKSV